MSNRPRAIVLLSGGLDSATTLAIAKKQEFELYAMTFNWHPATSTSLRIEVVDECTSALVKKWCLIELQRNMVGGIHYRLRPSCR